MHKEPSVYITGVGFICALAESLTAYAVVLQAHAASKQHAVMSGVRAFELDTVAGNPFSLPAAPLSPPAERALAYSDDGILPYDRATRMARYAGQQALRQAGWASSANIRLGVNIGASRGTTATWEAMHNEFVNTDRLPPLASPLTTSGGIASAVLQDSLMAEDGAAVAFTHSMTCSTAAFALANGVAWLRAGMATHFLAGGTEAPLTPFTFAQMRALRVQASQLPSSADPYPCKPFNTQSYGMVLGEGAAVFALELHDTPPTHALAKIEAIGWGAERPPHPAGMTPTGECLRQAMGMALAEVESKTGSKPHIPLVLAHAPGTRAGDAAEAAALSAVFSKDARAPYVISNKWRLGHSLGAAAGLALAEALLYLQGVPLAQPPYSQDVLAAQFTALPTQPPKRVMVNAAGFGGNAVSIILGVCD